MDGVDAAMVLSDGEAVFEFGATGFRPYSQHERALIANAQGGWPGEARVDLAAAVVEKAHVDLVARFGGAALVGFHGQTLAHDPDGGKTHQAGDGAAVARAVGLPIAWDFRTADMAAGGQGAPLAPFYHFALARRFDLGRVAFLNLGGVGNVTFVDPTRPGPEAPGALLAFDTGPANALLDDFMHQRTGLACDYGGALAALGKPDTKIVAGFLAHPYFGARPPKSLDRNTFAGLAGEVAALGDADGLATLAECTVQAVAAGMQLAGLTTEKLLVCGGGRKNAHLMTRLGDCLNFPVSDVDDAGMDGDMLEAQAFACLAIRVQRGLPISAPGTTGVAAPQAGGRISLP